MADQKWRWGVRQIALQRAAVVDVLFCHLHLPWQRPPKEHINRLLSQAFPKSIEPDPITCVDLGFIVTSKNPRSTTHLKAMVLGRKTSADVYPEAVAVTG